MRKAPNRQWAAAAGKRVIVHTAHTNSGRMSSFNFIIDASTTTTTRRRSVKFTAVTGQRGEATSCGTP